MLRQAVASDIPGIQLVRSSVRENRLVSTTISDDEVRHAIEVSGRGWVVESQGQIVGFSIGDATNGNVWALFVHPDHERRGHGRRLHDIMLTWLWSQGLDRLWLTTEVGSRAQSFYEAAGWQPAGHTERGELRFEIQRPDKSDTGWKRLIASLKAQASQLRRQTLVVFFAARDPRMPWHVRVIALLVAAYAVSPIDLIPDFIPVIGYLDDLLLVPLGIALVIRLAPPDVLESARAQAQLSTEKPVSYVAAAIVAAIWVLLLAIAIRWAGSLFGIWEK